MNLSSNPRPQSRSSTTPSSKTLVSTNASGKGPAEMACVDLTTSLRTAVMLTPGGQGPLRQQVTEVLSALKSALRSRAEHPLITAQTIFLKNPADLEECEFLLQEHYGESWPVTNFVFQPPCNGASLAMEAWGIGGPSVSVKRYNRNVLSVTYDQMRWVYCAGIRPPPEIHGVYHQAQAGLRNTSEALQDAGSDFQHVVRTWFYLGGITDSEHGEQRYKELNRARTDYYHDIQFCRTLLDPNTPRGVYPASTGIGMQGSDLVLGCVALQTNRDDVFLLPLENPQQTPAYAYHPKYSPKSPKFSRAMALVAGDYVTTWISGTASIVDSESCHVGDIEKQTEQTISNIERLIAPENFKMHGIPGTGAGLNDLAKVRVYIKRPQDFEKCRAVCQQKLGNVPAIYAVADVCRPELLVEIEGVAFSRCATPLGGKRRAPEGK